MNAIVCIDMNRGIGLDNELLFREREDTKFFVKKTIGKTVIMGRKTKDSLPEGFLPNRMNLVLSNGEIEETEIVKKIKFEDLSSYLFDNDTFVIGGQSVYEQLLQYCRTAYVTKVHAEKKANKFFPDLTTLENGQWVRTNGYYIRSKESGLVLEFITYENLKMRMLG